VKLDAPLRTDRLILRTLRPRLDNGYFVHMNDPAINRFLEVRHSNHTAKSVSDYIRAMRASSTSLGLACCLADGSDRHIGNIRLSLTPLHGRGEIGLVIWAQDLWGRGYAREMIAAVTDHAFTALNTRKVTAGAYATNVGSIRAFQAAGFRIEGRFSQHWRDGDGYADHVAMAKFAPHAADGAAAPELHSAAVGSP